MSLNKEWNKFILGEGFEDRNIFTYLQGIQEIVATINPKSIKEERRLALAKQHLKEARRSARQMQNELQILQERLTILEENLNEGS
mgnify:CR=1 FL=1